MCDHNFTTWVSLTYQFFEKAERRIIADCREIWIPTRAIPTGCTVWKPLRIEMFVMKINVAMHGPYISPRLKAGVSSWCGRSILCFNFFSFLSFLFVNSKFQKTLPEWTLSMMPEVLVGASVFTSSRHHPSR